MQNSQSQTDHLQILTSRGRGDISRLRSDVVNDSSLEPGDEEMSAFFNDILFNPGKTIEDDGSGAASDVVHGTDSL
jgi:hypothetical protein